ncbi:MAG: ACT domain-containing protein [Bacillota bacterium]
MTLRQVSVFLENRPGRLALVSRVLGDAGLRIRAASISDTTDFGVLRLILDNPSEGLRALKQAGLMASETEVLGVEIPDKPGGLAGVFDLLREVNIEYMYSFVDQPSRNAIVLFRVEDVDRAVGILETSGVSLVNQDTVSTRPGS